MRAFHLATLHSAHKPAKKRPVPINRTTFTWDNVGAINPLLFPLILHLDPFYAGPGHRAATIMTPWPAPKIRNLLSELLDLL